MKGIIRTQWIPTDENEADMFTKNLDGNTFEKHLKRINGQDKYMKQLQFENDKLIQK
jgi:hypothetical protein